ncbi:MAG: glycosyltransferase [Paludibacter sp.]
MQILFLTSWYPTKKNPTVGIFIKEHAKAIHLAGNELVVIALLIETSKSLFTKNVLDYVDENGIQTIEIRLSTRFKDIIYHLIPIQYYICKQTFKSLVSKNFNPDIIHSNVIFPAGIIGSWLAKSIKKPYIITEHWSRINGLLKKPILSYWAKKSYKNASKIMPVSVFLQNRISNLIPEIETNKFAVVGNIVDSNTFNFKEKSNHENTLQFCAIATWANKKVADKLPELFIEALSKVQINEKRHVKLIMIGGGDKVEELKLLCKKNNLDADFTGYLDKIQISEHLQNSNFFVHASTVETFGVVTAEALLCGTPVICSNVGALPELVNDSNGVLCENTESSWIEGIKLAIGTKYDYPNIAKNIKNDFGLKTIGDKYNAVYSDICNESKI